MIFVKTMESAKSRATCPLVTYVSCLRALGLYVLSYLTCLLLYALSFLTNCVP